MSDDQGRSDTSVTAFADAEAALRERLQTASPDPHEFALKLTRCNLSECRGMCCYDGVPVDDDTAGVLQQLATQRVADFRDIGLALPDQVIVENEWRGLRSKKTAVRPTPFRAMVPDYPPHFEDTACVFHLDDGRCGLQVLAMRDGKHPWFYKPFPCWLHPIKISGSQMHIYDDATDPFCYPDYDGYTSRTWCGKTTSDGCPAADLLTEELQYLGKILDRDILAEVRRARGEGGKP